MIHLRRSGTAALPPAVRTAQISRAGPSGSCDGLATQSSRLGAEPRTKTTTPPLSDTVTSVMSMPLSSRNLVRRTGLKSGAPAE